MILVSACLLGLDTRYDGGSNTNDLLMEYSSIGKYIPICPEQLGGLPTPRSSVEIIDGDGKEVLAGKKRVVTREGQEVTNEFVKGAYEVSKLVKSFPVTAAILKERSPSCGVNRIYDGTFSGTVKAGTGITAALVQQDNIPIYSEEDINRELLEGLLG